MGKRFVTYRTEDLETLELDQHGVVDISKRLITYKSAFTKITWDGTIDGRLEISDINESSISPLAVAGPTIQPKFYKVSDEFLAVDKLYGSTITFNIPKELREFDTGVSPRLAITPVTISLEETVIINNTDAFLEGDNEFVMVYVDTISQFPVIISINGAGTFTILGTEDIMQIIFDDNSLTISDNFYMTSISNIEPVRKLPERFIDINFSNVAKTGDYNDLKNKPIGNFSGSWNDLTDKPSIPTDDDIRNIVNAQLEVVENGTY